jgi:hypothetical protein
VNPNCTRRWSACSRRRLTTSKRVARPRLSPSSQAFSAREKTFANRPLSEDHGLRIAVLINDFGDVDIDSELIVGITSNQISLANGCVCCEIRDDLITAIDSVLAADNQIDAIVLEASGVVEPLSIARTFVDASLPQSPSIARIIAVVDAEQLPAQVQDPVMAATRSIHTTPPATRRVISPSGPTRDCS